MSIQVFGTKKCRDTQKAIRYFKERRIKFHYVDLAEKPFSPGELNSIGRSIPMEELIDREGKQFRKRQLEYMKFDPYEEILDDPLLAKTPIVRSQGKAAAGFDPDFWKSLID